MSLRCLASGTLHADPEIRTSQGGKRYTVGKLKADAKDGSSAWVSLIAFGGLADDLGNLQAGDSIAVSGRAKVTSWKGKDGEPRAGMDITVDSLTTLKAAGTRQPTRAAGDDFDSKDHWSNQQPVTLPAVVDDFNDPIPF